MAAPPDRLAEYWRNGSVGHIADRIKCPAFLIGGWRDGYPNPPLRLYEALQVPQEGADRPVEPRPPDVAVPGPRIDHLHEVVRWLDHWCGGEANGVMDEPPVVVFMQHGEPPVVDRLESEGDWRAEPAWPVAGCVGERHVPGATTAGLAAQTGADGADDLTYDATVGVTASCGRAACTSACRATSGPTRRSR